VSKKIRVAVVYGGRSSEHEVSLESAKCVLDNLDPERFDVLPIAIDKQGAWHAQDLKALRGSRSKALPVDTTGASVALAPRPSDGELVGASGGAEGMGIDVVFPVMHGPLCEDGSIQGLFELADVAYVGSGVLGSAVAMDKDVAKRLVRERGLPTVEYVAARRADWLHKPAAVRAAAAGIGYPAFVKPASLGSSVGVTRVQHEGELDAALELAFRYDGKALVERAVRAREIELAVLSPLDPTERPEVSLPGEIIPKGGFYSYEHKYLDPDGAALAVPAELTQEQTVLATHIAREAFIALECEGMARIDLFLDRDTGQVLFNEANTIPGFTTISMYPKLWEASGLPYRALLSRLIELAIKRKEARSAMLRSR
jgi:D-alanine-D-alanine ligase